MTWLACHRHAFNWFGGVPGRIIIDNAKCAITKACINDPTVQRAYAEYAEGYLFRIDACPPHDEDFHHLIAERYERVSTMLTSNFDFAECGDVFPANRMLGVATLDRLRHGAYRLILEGDSFRAPRPLPESQRNAR